MARTLTEINKSLHSVGEYIGARHETGYRARYLCLDGDFDTEQLKKIVALMEEADQLQGDGHGNDTGN